MIKIRLARTGAKNDPHYRIVAIEHSKKRGGEALEIIGHWHPKKDVKKIDMKKYDKWLKNGAKPTRAVLNLINTK
jgi:small subunit ribosomal protein S16